MIRKYLPLLISLAFFFLLFKGLYQGQSNIPSPLIDKPMPAFNLPTLGTDQLITDQDIIGQISLINIWATWCPGCLEEHEFLVQLSNSPHAIPIVGINWKDKTELAQLWLEESGNPYSEVLVDSVGKTAIDFGVYGAPETFLIDEEGVIKYKHIGPLSTQIWNREIIPIIHTMQQ